MKNELTLQEWKEIGGKVKNVYKKLHELSDILNKKLPKTQYVKKLYSAEGGLGKLRSHLDDIICGKFKDMPNREITSIFYGKDEK